MSGSYSRSTRSLARGSPDRCWPGWVPGATRSRSITSASTATATRPARRLGDLARGEDRERHGLVRGDDGRAFVQEADERPGRSTRARRVRRRPVRPRDRSGVPPDLAGTSVVDRRSDVVGRRRAARGGEAQRAAGQLAGAARGAAAAAVVGAAGVLPGVAGIPAASAAPPSGPVVAAPVGAPSAGGDEVRSGEHRSAPASQCLPRAKGATTSRRTRGPDRRAADPAAGQEADRSGRERPADTIGRTVRGITPPWTGWSTESGPRWMGSSTARPARWTAPGHRHGERAGRTGRRRHGRAGGSPRLVVPREGSVPRPD